MLIANSTLMAFARKGGAALAAALAMSSQVYPSTEWTFTNTASETVEVFADGTNRNKLSATATTSVEHKLTKSFAVTAGATFKLNVRMAAGTTRYADIGIFKGTTLQASSSLDLQVGTASTGTITAKSDGSYMLNWDYVIPNNTTSMTVRILVQNSARTGTYTAAGENIYAGLLTFGNLSSGGGSETV
jgi:hypothetical protein